MVSAQKPPANSKRRRPPATTPEGRENQMIALATDLAEKQMLAGTASSQVITHFLKLGSSRNKLEMAKIRSDVSLGEARTSQMRSAEHTEELYTNAMNAFKAYSGQEIVEDDED